MVSKTVLAVAVIYASSGQADSPTEVSPKMSPQAEPASLEMEPLELLQQDVADLLWSEWYLTDDWVSSRSSDFWMIDWSLEEEEAPFDVLSNMVPSTASPEPWLSLNFQVWPCTNCPGSWVPVSNPNLRTLSMTPRLEHPMLGHPTWSPTSGPLLRPRSHLRQMATPTSGLHGRLREPDRLTPFQRIADLRRQGASVLCKHPLASKGQCRQPSTSANDHRHQQYLRSINAKMANPRSDAVSPSTNLVTATAMVDQFLGWLDVLGILSQAGRQNCGGAELDGVLPTGDSTNGGRLLPTRRESAQDSSSAVRGTVQSLVMAC